MKKIALALSAALLCQMAMAKGIQTGAAYARPTVEGQNAGGVFVNLKNTDKKDNVLVGASVQPSIADSTELHTHINENGVMKMREVKDGIPLPAGKTQKLEPGGYHVMLMDLKQPLTVGKTFPLTLKFKDGSSKQVTVRVRKMQDTMMKHDHGHDHGGHDHNHGGHDHGGHDQHH